jgi:hypothetical protein
LQLLHPVRRVAELGALDDFVARMKLRHVYLLLCVLGLILPYWQFVPWVMVHGFKMPLFFHELFANRIGGFFAMDVLVSAIVLIVFVAVDGRRLHMRSRWWAIIALVLAGVSLGLPLFLYLRELELERAK